MPSSSISSFSIASSISGTAAPTAAATKTTTTATTTTTTTTTTTNNDSNTNISHNTRNQWFEVHIHTSTGTWHEYRVQSIGASKIVCGNCSQVLISSSSSQSNSNASCPVCREPVHQPATLSAGSVTATTVIDECNRQKLLPFEVARFLQSEHKRLSSDEAKLAAALLPPPLHSKVVSQPHSQQHQHQYQQHSLQTTTTALETDAASLVSPPLSLNSKTSTSSTSSTATADEQPSSSSTTATATAAPPTSVRLGFVLAHRRGSPIPTGERGIKLPNEPAQVQASAPSKTASSNGNSSTNANTGNGGGIWSRLVGRSRRPTMHSSLPASPAGRFDASAVSAVSDGTPVPLPTSFDWTLVLAVQTTSMLRLYRIRDRSQGSSDTASGTSGSNSRYTLLCEVPLHGAIINKSIDRSRPGQANLVLTRRDVALVLDAGLDMLATWWLCGVQDALNKIFVMASASGVSPEVLVRDPVPPMPTMPFPHPVQPSGTGPDSVDSKQVQAKSSDRTLRKTGSVGTFMGLPIVRRLSRASVAPAPPAVPSQPVPPMPISTTPSGLVIKPTLESPSDTEQRTIRNRSRSFSNLAQRLFGSSSSSSSSTGPSTPFDSEAERKVFVVPTEAPPTPAASLAKQTQNQPQSKPGGSSSVRRTKSEHQLNPNQAVGNAPPPPLPKLPTDFKIPAEMRTVAANALASSNALSRRASTKHVSSNASSAQMAQTSTDKRQRSATLVAAPSMHHQSSGAAPKQPPLPLNLPQVRQAPSIASLAKQRPVSKHSAQTKDDTPPTSPITEVSQIYQRALQRSAQSLPKAATSDPSDTASISSSSTSSSTGTTSSGSGRSSGRSNGNIGAEYSPPGFQVPSVASSLSDLAGRSIDSAVASVSNAGVPLTPRSGAVKLVADVLPVAIGVPASRTASLADFSSSRSSFMCAIDQALQSGGHIGLRDTFYGSSRKDSLLSVTNSTFAAKTAACADSPTVIPQPYHDNQTHYGHGLRKMSSIPASTVHKLPGGISGGGGGGGPLTFTNVVVDRLSFHSSSSRQLHATSIISPVGATFPATVTTATPPPSSMSLSSSASAAAAAAAAPAQPLSISHLASPCSIVASATDSTQSTVFSSSDSLTYSNAVHSLPQPVKIEHVEHIWAIASSTPTRATITNASAAAATSHPHHQHLRTISDASVLSQITALTPISSNSMVSQSMSFGSSVSGSVTANATDSSSTTASSALASSGDVMPQRPSVGEVDVDALMLQVLAGCHPNPSATPSPALHARNNLSPSVLVASQTSATATATATATSAAMKRSISATLLPTKSPSSVTSTGLDMLPSPVSPQPHLSNRPPSSFSMSGRSINSKGSHGSFITSKPELPAASTVSGIVGMFPQPPPTNL
ncbi:hypothetical protein GQ42DRAFT_65756 [Ramicandelaber brevisporus]|nr:hypothetical protein GQ42DRAFT_65756 [Ramicandelaber brevisporus]